MNHATTHELRRKQVEAYRNSGKTLQVWCEENQTSIHTLRYWIQKLNRQETDKSIPQWVSLINETPASSGITIRIGSAVIEVAGGVDPQLLQQVINVIQETC